MRRTSALAVALLVAAAGLVGAPGQTVIIPVGKVAVSVDPGCLARVVNGPYRKTLRNGVTDLPTGRYKVKARPGDCKAVPAVIRVREGKKTRVAVYNDPKIVPRKLMGTIQATQTTAGVKTAAWEGDIYLAFNKPAYTANTPGFETTASYRVTSFDGFYEIDAVDGPCTWKGQGTLSYEDLLAEGEVAPLWSNPWQGFRYAMQVPFDPARQWQYTRTCTDAPEPVNVERAVPPLLFTTNAWDGLDPVAPLGKGSRPSGQYSVTIGDTRYDYAWSFSVWDASERRLSKPA
ncbi:MAG: hypothetical protein MUF33_08225 [Candidatus Nanopelagicales bacterium]|nr:hypothetical protein [Candidatus Nanopelagicales bacterium]MCU0295697.1 hypothetical protein [Candidatus Nanopelagicales bacterium]MCU0298490.1 hypothetical protein [Candidatus Nanopelagicales bacterium]